MLRILAALATALVAVAVLGGIPASASTPTSGVVTSCSNAACPDPSGWAAERFTAHAGYPSNGGTVNGANCTNYVAWRLIRTNGLTETAVRGLGNALSWDTNAAAKGYVVDRVPSVGAVAQWDANHVAYVEQVNSDGTIVISESNVWAGSPSNRMWLRYRVVTASAVDHFIHFRLPALKNVLAPGDFDGDGLADMMVIVENGRLDLYSGDGAGGFLNPAGTQIGSGWATMRTVLAPGDFTGDGHPDVMAVDTAGRMFLYSGDGAGRWLPPKKQIGTGWQKMRFVFSPGDFTSDGFSDLLAVRSDGRLVLYGGNGAGGFRSGTRPVIGTGFQKAKLVSSPGDVDGDGKADVVAVFPNGTVKLYPGNGKNGLLNKAGIVIATGWTDVSRIAGAGDATGDGHADLFALRTGSRLFLHPGDGAVFGDGAALSVTW